MFSLLFSIVPNWPVLLAFVGVVSRLAMAPLFKFGFEQQRRLAKAKPFLDQIPRDDTFLTRSSLVKREHGVREGWLLLSMAAQIAAFIWIFNSVKATSALSSVGFAWIPSLAHADPWFVLPVIAAIVAYFASQVTVTPVKKWMPYLQSGLTFVFFFALPSGVAIYSIAAQITQAGLQWSFARSV